MPAARQVQQQSAKRPILLTYDVKQEREYTEQGLQTTRVCVPMIVDANMIRCHYPRHSGHPGTRITFQDGHGLCVLEPYEEVTYLVYGNQEIPAARPEALPPAQQLTHNPADAEAEAVE